MTGARAHRRLLGAAGALLVAACVVVPVSAGRSARGFPGRPVSAAAETPAPAPPPPAEPAAPAGAPAAALTPVTVAPPAPGPAAAVVPAPPATRRPAPPTVEVPTRPATPKAQPPAAPAYPDGATVIRIGTWSAVVERGDQAVIDRCKATLFWGPWPAERPGTVWLAGHDHCGFGFWAGLPVGTTVTFAGPHGTAAYAIVDHTWLPRKGGPSQGLIHDDLILQTCHGSGTSLTYAARRS